MSRRWRYLAEIRRNRDRQLVIAGLILAMICVALCVNLTIMLTRNSDKNETSIDNGTNASTVTFYNTISTLLSSTVASTKVRPNTSPFIFPVTPILPEGKLQNRSFAEPIIYENLGLPLNNKLYCTYTLFSLANGFVIQVNLRLFSEWKGDVSLYLFVIANGISAFRIVHRYAVKPQRNTTEWQMIDVPFGALPISLGSLLALGMQDTGDGLNEVQAVKVPYSIRGENINEKTTNFTHTLNGLIAPAFTYIIVHFPETTTTKSTSVP